MGRLAIRVARVFDGERVLDDAAVVLVADGRIVGVERTAVPPAGWPVRDLRHGTVLPGLIDAHVHLCADSGPGSLDRLAEHSRQRLEATIEASLRAHLAAGVTTVRDLGDQNGAVMSWHTDPPRCPSPVGAADHVRRSSGARVIAGTDAGIGPRRVTTWCRAACVMPARASPSNRHCRCTATGQGRWLVTMNSSTAAPAA